MTKANKSFSQPADDIESWFAIGNYKATANFSREDWYRNLYFRSLARAVIFPKRFRDDPQPPEYRVSSAEYVWSAVCNTPLIERASGGQLAAIHGTGMADPVDDVTRRLSLSSVRPLTRYDLVRTRKRDGMQSVVDIWKRLPSRFATDAQAATRQNDLGILHQALDLPGNIDNNRVRLSVDLDASNELILSDFKTWLDRARQVYRSPTESRAKHTITDHLVEQWSRRHVLAYLDIMLWCRLSDHRVSGIEWHRLLAPRGYAASLRMEKPDLFDVEIIGETAQKALSDETLDALYLDVLAASRQPDGAAG